MTKTKTIVCLFDYAITITKCVLAHIPTNNNKKIFVCLVHTCCITPVFICKHKLKNVHSHKLKHTHRVLPKIHRTRI